MNTSIKTLDAVRAETLPDGAASGVGIGPHGGRVKLEEGNERLHVERWLNAMRLVERIKAENHPNQVRAKAREIVEQLLDASGA